MYLNSTTTSPSSTLERQPVGHYSLQQDSPTHAADDHPGYRIIDNDNVHISPMSDEANFHLTSNNDQYSSVTVDKKKPKAPIKSVEYVDPRATKFDWAYGLCSCCNDGEGVKWCCLSTFCPCYVAGRVAEAAGDNGIACCIVEVLCPFSCFFGALVRRKIRLQRNIVGNTCGDLMATFCCRQCALVQQAREQNLPILHHEQIERK